MSHHLDLILEEIHNMNFMKPTLPTQPTQPKSYLDELYKELEISIYPSPKDYEDILAAFKRNTGHDDIFANKDLYERIRNEKIVMVKLHNVTLRSAMEFAEPIRIAYPTQNVNIIGANNLWVGMTTWEDQVKYFFDYPTYTPWGATLIAQRKAEAKEKNILPSWG